MTTRRTRKVPASPEAIAARVPPVAMEMFPPKDYRAYFQALTEEVEEITGSGESELTMRVAETLGVSPVDWFRSKLQGA